MRIRTLIDTSQPRRTAFPVAVCLMNTGLFKMYTYRVYCALGNIGVLGIKASIE